jgi:hypothetical protein
MTAIKDGMEMRALEVEFLIWNILFTLLIQIVGEIRY